MLLARAFARAELDPGRSVQQAMVNAMEAQSRSGPTALSPEELSDHFAELAAALDNDPFAIYAELASMAAVFPTEHNAAVAGALARSENEAVREAALGFIFSPDRAARWSPSRSNPVWCPARQWIGWCVCALGYPMRRANIDTAVRALRPKAAPAASVRKTRGVSARVMRSARGSQTRLRLRPNLNSTPGGIVPATCWPSPWSRAWRASPLKSRMRCGHGRSANRLS